MERGFYETSLRVGDRVELSRGKDVFGKIVRVIRCENTMLEVELADGQLVWRTLFQVWFAPSRDAIESSSSEIRAGWSRAQERNRRGVPFVSRHDDGSPVPLVVVNDLVPEFQGINDL